MSIRNLDRAFRPQSVAVVGASDREGSVGTVVLRNIVEGGFEGPIWPVNPKYAEVMGRACFARAADLPAPPDIAVIVTPAATVPGIVAEFGQKGTKAVVLITAGLTEKNGLLQKLLDAARPHLLRVIGPNTLGLMIPPAKLNAGFGHMAANPGNLALLSQSGAIATSLIDWAADKRIGFSHIVSLGDMADVDVGDYLDLLANDAETRAILMYLETIPNPRKFMSAARAASRLKPVIVVKSGRHEASAHAAATHTGALSGADRVADAALRRAGTLRVHGLGDLFEAAETTARFSPLERARLGIVTNGGGAGVLAIDQLLDGHGELAELASRTIRLLDKALPPHWSKANPVDIIGDAGPERYVAAIEAVAEDRGVDALLVINCPTGLASPTAAAEAVARKVEHGMVAGKPVLSCWLGDHTARTGRAILQEAGVASFETPSEASRAITHLTAWSAAQKALMRVPAGSAETEGHVEEVAAIFRAVADDGRTMLTEPEAKAVLAAYGIDVPETRVAETPKAAGEAAEALLETSAKVVVKLLSREITHKSDVGGVVLNLETAEAAEKAAAEIEFRVRALGREAAIDGYAVQPMVAMKNAHELILGISRDPIFGPVVLFGAGGVSVEVVDDTAIALPPLDDVLCGDLIERTRIGRLLAGYRDRQPADRRAIFRALNAVSLMVVDFPCIMGMDINPLLANHEGAVALDARIEIDPARVGEPGPNPDLAIRPYPAQWESRAELGNAVFLIRPIRPVDVALYPAFLARVSDEDLRMRFLSPRKSFTDDMLKRMTQLDYNRDMALVALDRPDGALAGIARLSADPDRDRAEFGILIRSDMQGAGLGRVLMRRLIDYAEAEGIARIEGAVLRENTRMLDFCRHFGFTVRSSRDEPGVTTVSLDLAPGRKPKASGK